MHASRQSVGHQVTDDTDTADRADGEPRQVQPVITGVVIQAGGGDHLRPAVRSPFASLAATMLGCSARRSIVSSATSTTERGGMS